MLSLVCFFAYCAVFPGSTITVALDAVPAWGLWMGAAMLIVQGLAVIFWALGMYGARGALAVGLATVLAWAVEHIGETTGLPFGRYQYTDMLQPQILGRRAGSNHACLVDGRLRVVATGAPDPG
jgi:uncharacterized membrane protein